MENPDKLPPLPEDVLPKKAFKRRWWNYFLRNKLQNSLILYTLVATAICFIAIYIFFSSFVLQITELMETVTRDNREQLIQYLNEKSFNNVMLSIFGAITIVFLFLALFISHKIVGPIIHIKRHFQKLAETRSYDPLFFRKHDQLKDIADVINKYLETIKTKR